jgi:hypothetical protein
MRLDCKSGSAEDDGTVYLRMMKNGNIEKKAKSLRAKAKKNARLGAWANLEFTCLGVWNGRIGKREK